MYFKTIVVFISLLSIVGCGPSAEEKEEMSYDTGYSTGYNEGFLKALECVKREGGEAEDAADDCRRRM
jgi:hypothetical protein